ncbi:hypothetical protein HDU97_003248 [Phlyctochytrium planicorne]|nr:hypothetical protein HDU97_003248 [Phlyctochytrium planicorne]
MEFRFGHPLTGNLQPPAQSSTPPISQPALPQFGTPSQSAGNSPYAPASPMGNGTPQQLSNSNSPYASPQMTARPLATGGSSFQGPVKGIHGWNDPPNLIGVKSKKSGAPQDAAPAPSAADIDAGLIGSAMVTAMTVIKQAAAADPSQRKIVDDTDRRLEELLERLGEKSIPFPVMAQLAKVSEAINARDIPGASNASVQLTLLSSAHSSEARWILGVKRLIELYAKFGGN